MLFKHSVQSAIHVAGSKEVPLGPLKTGRQINEYLSAQHININLYSPNTMHTN